jgi:hypothetical protein
MPRRKRIFIEITKQASVLGGLVSALRLGGRGRMDVRTGLFLRDLACIRLGRRAFGFSAASLHELKQDCCFTLIGSERSLSFQAPTAV